LFDEYHQLDCEDVIGDGLKTRFKYTTVQKDDFGLTNDEILLLDDKKLNQVVSLKKYRPYREQQQFTSEQERDRVEKIQLYKTLQRKKDLRKEVNE
jgi:protein KRI1